MYSLLDVVTLVGDDREVPARALREAAQDLPGLRGALIAPTLDGVYNGGDLIVRLSFDDADAAQRARNSAAGQAIRAVLDDPTRVANIEHVSYPGGSSGGPIGGGSVYRVALFCANVRPDAERLARFARHSEAMPEHVSTIRRWQLSEPVATSGIRPWTHVWEQEYAELSGLLGAYMMHPVHWAHIERWFDPEYPEWLVDTQLVHTFCAIDDAVILE